MKDQREANNTFSTFIILNIPQGAKIDCISDLSIHFIAAPHFSLCKMLQLWGGWCLSFYHKQNICCVCVFIYWSTWSVWHIVWWWACWKNHELYKDPTWSNWKNVADLFGWYRKASVKTLILPIRSLTFWSFLEKQRPCPMWKMANKRSKLFQRVGAFIWCIFILAVLHAQGGTHNSHFLCFHPQNNPVN